MIDSLCWSCKRADLFMHEGLYCPWSANFMPVNGWDAEPTKIISAEIEDIIDSFHVKACPLYEPEKGRRDKQNGRVQTRQTET